MAMGMMLKRFLAEDSGATSIEYGLICAMIALAIMAILGTTGEKLVTMLTGLLNAFP
jgi:pilus assembly protein Flp/PilA